MNLPNRLTLMRFILVPFFVFFMLTDVAGGAGKWIALVIFCGASLTDALDGYLSRSRHLVTNFGKFMDPLADKLLVCSAMICMIPTKVLPAWFVIVILAREFIISGFRLVAADNGIVIAASYWGKFKTVSQMALIIVLIADLGGVFTVIGQILMWVALILTVVSLVDYLVKNRQVLSDTQPETKEAAIVAWMTKRQLTLTTAESCTAGLLAGRIMNVPGASAIYKEGYVTYANEAKEKLLGVRAETLAAYGAVSEQTAAEMACGAAKAAGADAALSVTGIAGPDGGTQEKPVGLVYIGCYLKGETKVQECRFTGDRNANRESSVEAALTLLWECIKEDA